MPVLQMVPSARPQAQVCPHISSRKISLLQQLGIQNVFTIKKKYMYIYIMAITEEALETKQEPLVRDSPPERASCPLYLAERDGSTAVGFSSVERHLCLQNRSYSPPPPGHLHTSGLSRSSWSYQTWYFGHPTTPTLTNIWLFLL